jgi:hypothetical protein
MPTTIVNKNRIYHEVKKSKFYSFTLNAGSALMIRRTMDNIKYDSKKQFKF